MKLRNRNTGEIVVFGEGIVDLAKIGCKNVAEMMGAGWEDYEEPKEYWFIDSGGEVKETTYLTENDKYSLRNFGNYFETKEEAEKAVEKLKAWKRLKDRGFIFCGYEALGCGEIHFTSDWDIEDEYEKGQRRKDLDLLFGGEE